MKLNSDKEYLELFHRIIAYMNSVHSQLFFEIASAYNEFHKMNMMSAITYLNKQHECMIPIVHRYKYTYDEFLSWLIIENSTSKECITFFREDISLAEIDLQLTVRGF